MAEEDPSKIMKITVKTPKEKQEIEIGGNAHVKELREMVSQKFSAPVEQLCLIFAGKILKDEDSLEQHGIKDGLTVHLVIKSTNRSQEQAAQRATQSPASGTPSGPTNSEPSQPDISQTPFGLGGLGGLAGMGNLGMGSANFMEMQRRMQSEMMQNPEMLRQMMDNPMVQSLMSNPEVMRQMITSNPQMRELMERNPEITHMLNNPELMRQTMELARNPAMMQELMRSQDRAMSNLESLPGGFNALQRMYRDIQEPMLNAAQEGMGNNPFAALVNNGAGGANEQQGRENTDPLPNPWAPSQTSNTSTAPSNSSTDNSTGTSSAPRQSTGMFDSPGMQSLMSQMTQNPQMMDNMLQAPYMQAMLQQMSSNPEMAQSILSANPMFSNNPQLQEQMRQQLPTMLQQLQNPNVQGFLTNPRALQAMMRIQQGMQDLQQEAPGLFPGVVPTPPTGSTATTTTSSITTSSTESSTTSTAGGTTSTAGDTPASTTTTSSSTPAQGPEQMSNLMAHMMNLMAQGSNNQPPEQRYATQLDQMAAMGFLDREQNLRALVATLGNVNDAVDRILSSNS